MARRVVLSDASPPIAFSLLGRLDLLHALLGRITITDVVQSEILAGGERPGQTAIAAAIRARRIRAIIDRWAEPRLPDLDEGEASTLRAAIHQSLPCLVLIDERAGRAVAKELGIAHVGTVGVIVQAKKRGLVPAARTLFEQLFAQDFRVSAGLINEALAQVGED
jgi:predicted nucleic acid-binding protein